MNKETGVELLFSTILPDITKNIVCEGCLQVSPNTLAQESKHFVFQIAIQKLKDQDIQNYNFARGYVWV